MIELCDEARASEGLIHELLTSVSRTEICIERWHLVDTLMHLLIFGEAFLAMNCNAMHTMLEHGHPDYSNTLVTCEESQLHITMPYGI